MKSGWVAAPGIPSHSTGKPQTHSQRLGGGERRPPRFLPQIHLEHPTPGHGMAEGATGGHAVATNLGWRLWGLGARPGKDAALRVPGDPEVPGRDSHLKLGGDAMCSPRNGEAAGGDAAPPPRPLSRSAIPGRSPGHPGGERRGRRQRRRRRRRWRRVEKPAAAAGFGLSWGGRGS